MIFLPSPIFLIRFIFRFIYSIINEAVLKALFKIKVSDLTFTRAIEIATETEDAAKVAKETVRN